MRKGGHRARDPLLLGILGFAALGLITYLGFTKRIPFQQGYRVEAVFRTSNQLRKASPVRIAGVDVGRVLSIRGGDGDTSIVTIEIADGGRPVHEDATLRIRPRLFLEGGFYVELSPGSPTAEELGSGGTIPLGQTSTPVQFHQILSTFDRPTREALQSTIAQLRVALDQGGAQAVGQLTRPLAPALRDGAIVAEAARGTQPRDLPALIGSLARVTTTLAERDVELAGTVNGLNRTMRALASRDRQLAASIRKLDVVLAETPRTLAATDSILEPTERISRDIRPTLQRLPGDLEQASDVLEQVRGAVREDELPTTIDHLDPALRELPRLERRLIRLFRLSKPVTDCLNKRAVPVLKSKLDDGALSTGQPVWLELAHAMVGLTSQAQTFDGNGHTLRYLAGGLNLAVATDPVPGLGQLVGLAANPVLGANPLWFGPGSTPPLNASQPCVGQDLPDLGARVGISQAPGFTTLSLARAARDGDEDLTSMVQGIVEALQEQAREAGGAGRGDGDGGDGDG